MAFGNGTFIGKQIINTKLGQASINTISGLLHRSLDKASSSVSHKLGGKTKKRTKKSYYGGVSPYEFDTPNVVEDDTSAEPSFEPDVAEVVSQVDELQVDDPQVNDPEVSVMDDSEFTGGNIRNVRNTRKSRKTRTSRKTRK